MLEIAAFVVGGLALLGAVIGVGLGIPSLIFAVKAADKNDVATIIGKLDQILKNEGSILAELKELEQEVEWSEILNVIATPIGKIQHFYNELQGLLPPKDKSGAELQRWIDDHKSDFDAWAAAVLGESDGMKVQIGIIDSAFEGLIVKKVAEFVARKVREAPFHSQSPYFMAALKLRQIQFFEYKAIGALAAAYKQKNPSISEENARKHFQPEVDLVAKRQAEVSRPSLEGLDRYIAMGQAGEGSGIPLEPITWTGGKGVVYFDQREVVAEDGKAVVEVSPYQNNDQVSLKIRQAPLNQIADCDSTNVTERSNDSTDGSPIQYGKNETVALMTMEVPAPTEAAPAFHMVTGVRFAKGASNQLVILLQYAPFDFNAGRLDLGQRAWTTIDRAVATKSWQASELFIDKWVTSTPDGRAQKPERGVDGVGNIAYEGQKRHPTPSSPIVGIKLATNVGEGLLQMFARTDFYRL